MEDNDSIFSKVLYFLNLLLHLYLCFILCRCHIGPYCITISLYMHLNQAKCGFYDDCNLRVFLSKNAFSYKMLIYEKFYCQKYAL